MQWKISNELVNYPDALQLMEQRVADIHYGKADELVWLLEHPPLYTSGTSAKESDLLDSNRFPIFDAGRGGEYTYHGPGQRIAYVMLNLQKRQKSPDIKAFVYDLEQWIINILAHFKINGQRRDGRIGIWVENDACEEKIAALGIRIRRGITFHGIAININPDLEHFSGIVPCGINNYGVTSMQKLGFTPSMEEVDKIIQQEFKNIFG